MPPRVMWNAASGVLAAHRTLPRLQNLMTNGLLRGYVASQAKKRVAKRAAVSTIQHPTRSLTSAEVQR